MDNSKYKLTCGVFFSLLCHIQLPRKSASEHYLGEGDELTDSSMMYELISVIKEPSSTVLFDTGIINKFKNCKSSSLGWFDWYDEKTIKYFDRQICTNYKNTKSRMTAFINKTLDITGDNKEWLIASLIKVISIDNGLNDKAFTIGFGKTMTKEEFINQESYDLASFLLSLLHLIVVNKIDNTLGRDTIDEIAPPAGGSKRTIDNDFAGDNYWNLNVIFDLNKKEPQVDEPEANDIDEVVVELIDEPTAKNENDAKNIQNIQNATITNINGDQYNISGNLIINKK